MLPLNARQGPTVVFIPPNIEDYYEAQPVCFGPCTLEQHNARIAEAREEYERYAEEIYPHGFLSRYIVDVVMRWLQPLRLFLSPIVQFFSNCFAKNENS